jgi:hypothetical protein
LSESSTPWIDLPTSLCVKASHESPGALADGGEVHTDGLRVGADAHADRAEALEEVVDRRQLLRAERRAGAAHGGPQQVLHLDEHEPGPAADLLARGLQVGVGRQRVTALVEHVDDLLDGRLVADDGEALGDRCG